MNVTVIATKWHGDSVITLTFRDANGRPIERLLYCHDESSIEVVTTGRPWSFDADGGLPRKRSPTTPRCRLAGDLAAGEWDRKDESGPEQMKLR
jgi:hypothetical protein